MKELICKAFCESINVRKVPFGWAVSYSLAELNKDPLLFYISNPDSGEKFTIKDTGTTIPYLDGIGCDITSGTRKELFEEILKNHSASYSEESLEIFIKDVSKEYLPRVAVSFMHLLSQIHGMDFLSTDRIASTFKDDATTLIVAAVGHSASVLKDEPISGATKDWTPDLILSAKGRDPVAVFLVQNEQRILEALLLQSDIDKTKTDASVVALLERDGSIRKSTRIKAANRLDACPIFETDKQSAIERIAKQALGKRAA